MRPITRPLAASVPPEVLPLLAGRPDPADVAGAALAFRQELARLEAHHGCSRELALEYVKRTFPPTLLRLMYHGDAWARWDTYCLATLVHEEAPRVFRRYEAVRLERPANARRIVGAGEVFGRGVIIEHNPFGGPGRIIHDTGWQEQDL